MSHDHEEEESPLKQHAVLQLISYLERVEAGTLAARAVIDAFQPTIEDGYCVYSLFGEFRAAFGYRPGRQEALAPILALARKVSRYEHDDSLRMYKEPEWAQLVAMSGPVEAVGFRTCVHCGVRDVVMYTSGFTDEFGAPCDACGNVVFQSIWDDRPLGTCECGGRFRRTGGSCTGCGSTDMRVEQRSSYEYFASHRWRRVE